jgi:hypothetical protein
MLSTYYRFKGHFLRSFGSTSPRQKLDSMPSISDSAFDYSISSWFNHTPNKSKFTGHSSTLTSNQINSEEKKLHPNHITLITQLPLWPECREIILTQEHKQDNNGNRYILSTLKTSCNTCHSIWYTSKILLTDDCTHILRLLFIRCQEYLATSCHGIWHIRKILLTDGCTQFTSVIYRD